MLDERKVRERRRARTFVEIKFQENTIATVAMDGGTPMWRESLSLPFRPPQDDFTPSSLEQVREEVYFTLFDEVVEDDSNRGGEKCYQMIFVTC
jgi:coiled-coil and C2 domain-containing protein 2A